MKTSAVRSVLIGLLLTAAGCSLDYGKDTAVEADQIPLMVFDGLKQTAVRDGRVLYTMESGSSQVFQAKKQVRLKDFTFQEYDSDGKPASRGTASAAVVNTGTNDAKITGKLSARSEDLGVTLDVSETGGGLTWTNEERILKTEPETTVTLHKDDGSKIVAQSLTLDLAANQLELENGIEGTWTPETKDNADKTPAAQPSSSAPLP